MSQVRTRGKHLQWLRRDWRLYVMLILPLTQYILFRYLPMSGVLIAFQKYNLFKGIWGSKWVGLDNFEFIFSLKDFGQAMYNTLLLNFLDLVAGFPIPIILAIMLTEMRSLKLKRVSQTLLYLPHFLSWVIIGGMVLEIFAPTYGIINKTIISLGGENIPFLSSGPAWVATYVGVGVWQNMGWGTILYLAAITNINVELYEAAEIDDANKLQRIWHVTLPGIRSTIVILLILNIGQMMNIGFDRPFITGNTLVQKYCDVISTFVYRVAMKGAKYDRGAAIGLFQSVIGFVMIMTANWITRKIGEESIWYLTIKDLGMINTVWSLILPGVSSTYNMVIMKNFFLSLPHELEEAANIDGANDFQILWRIILPLSLPSIATLSLFYAVGKWNSFSDALYYAQDRALQPLQLKLYYIIKGTTSVEISMVEGNAADVGNKVSESIESACIMFATLPILIVYPFVQKYFVQGATVGAVKG